MSKANWIAATVKRVAFHLLLILVIVSALLVADHIAPLSLTRFTEVSKELRSEKDELLHVFQTKDEKWRLQARVQEVDSFYLKLLIAREDQFYWYHPGINPLSMFRAGFQRLYHGKIISGGSTLTMQVVRLLEPRPRTLWSKLLELLRACQLEYHFSKEQILEMYLTLAPYGGNLEGIRAASLAYFGKVPAHLAPAEAALLVALPQLPQRWRGNHFSPSMYEARNRVLRLAAAQRLIDLKTLDIAQAEPLPPKRLKLPRDVPHLARRLCVSAGVSYCFLQPQIQKQVEMLALEALKSVPPEVNIAILVAHHPSHRVISYVGSADFFDIARQGQVDFIQAYRSPGSTLKPFIYGLGFEQGLIQPTTYVLDDRQRFGSYLPDNFDKTFHGMITVSEALALSLNIPAVAVLNQVGPQRFLGVLEEAGIAPRFPDTQSVPGLSLALGGVGMTLEQLVTLYMAVAQEGKCSPLIFSKSSSVQEPRQLFNALTSQRLTNILRNTLVSDFGQAPLNLAVKTGTSYGHRDAWAIGYNPDYVVGIWIGRPDGATFGVGTGRTLAVPILQRVFKLLPRPTRCWEGTAYTQVLPATSSQDQAHLLKQRPHMLFPIDGTVLEFFTSHEQPRSIVFNVIGGKRPYTWLIDGFPYATRVWHPKTHWHPAKPGFYTVTLMDAQGCIETARIEIQ